MLDITTLAAWRRFLTPKAVERVIDAVEGFLEPPIESLLSIFVDVFDGNFLSSYDSVRGETRRRNVKFLSAWLSDLRQIATRRMIPVQEDRTRLRRRGSS